MHARTFALAGLATLGLVAGSARARAGDAPVDASAKKAFKVTFKTKIAKPAEGSKRLEIWIPAPYQDEVQSVRDLNVTASVPVEQTKDEATGNRFLHAVVENPAADVTIDWTAVVERPVDAGQAKGETGEAYLKSDTMAKVDGRAKTLAQELGVDDPKVPVRDRARRIYDHVLQSMTYDKETPGWGKGDFERSLDVCKGNCSDFAAKFITLARAAGIPARWSSTVSLASDHMDCAACGYHCYAHYLDDGKWVPVDPSDARRIVAKDPKKADWYFGHAAANNIVLTVGRDLTLAPKQQGGPINFMAKPYVEVDGEPVDVPKEGWQYAAEPATVASK
jgi:transglutaminase-like putative cysteine protease